MFEKNRRRRIDQILATGMTREEMAEALQSAERSAHIWQTCTNAVREENAEIRAQMDGLIKILRNDHDLDACWDGLRHFWCIELTDKGIRKRDKLDGEVAKLRELVRDLYSQLLYAYDPKEIDEYRDRMCELEIEVGKCSSR